MHNPITASLLAVIFVSTVAALWPFSKSNPSPAPQFYGSDQGYYKRNPPQQQQYGCPQPTSPPFWGGGSDQVAMSGSGCGWQAQPHQQGSGTSRSLYDLFSFDSLRQLTGSSSSRPGAPDDLEGVHMSASQDAYDMYLDAPGYYPNEISVSVDDRRNALDLYASHRCDPRSPRACIERQRSLEFLLPPDVRVSDVQAAYDHGVLRVHAPRKTVVQTPQMESKERRQIQVHEGQLPNGGVVGGIRSGLKSFLNPFGGGGGQGGDMYGGSGERTYEQGREMIDRVRDQADGAYQQASQAAGEMYQQASQVAGGAAQQATQAGRYVTEAAGEAAHRAAQAGRYVTDAAGNVIHRVAEGAGRATETARQAYEQATGLPQNLLQAATRSGADPMRGWFGGAVPTQPPQEWLDRMAYLYSHPEAATEELKRLMQQGVNKAGAAHDLQKRPGIFGRAGQILKKMNPLGGKGLSHQEYQKMYGTATVTATIPEATFTMEERMYMPRGHDF
ncbi:hypothetical protein BJ742DRAFT_887970 [Cladochytrium replicatum]|nr:hypothetical protein BJ742DRAFT_887970 [Cladochytrium replicatum]